MFSLQLSSRSLKGVQKLSIRSICHKSKLKPKTAYRWPYETRSYGMLNFYLDPFTFRKMDENSKIIQVEGNISSGKEEFAKQLAEELGMAYFPQPDLESYYINKHGYDYRALNPLLPERMRLCDWEMFHENPSRHSVIHMQYYLQRLRLFSYIRAVSHLFNTGQGVVMTRTCFTERAIVEAMHNVGWLPKGYLRDDGVRFYDWIYRYRFLRNLALHRLLTPHLTIYLDTPVETCLERIKNDPDPMIADSRALTSEFLQEIERAFRETVLPKQDMISHVLVVDHPEKKTRDEILDVIDMIEPLDFTYEKHDTRFSTWNDDTRIPWYFEKRRVYTSMILIRQINLSLTSKWYDIAGLGDSITHADMKLRNALFENHVGPMGYNQDYDTDRRVHGLLRYIFGTYDNYGERFRKGVYTDFV